MDNLRILRVIGERPLDGGGRRWSRFKTEHPIPRSCDVRRVMARFYDNILNITFPKLITQELKPAILPTQTLQPELEPTPEPEKKQEPESRKEEEEEVKEKKKVEEEERDVYDGEKEKKGGVFDAPEVLLWPEKMGIGFFPMMTWRRKLVVNIFVSVFVIVVIGIYVGYKLRSGGWGGRGE